MPDFGLCVCGIVNPPDRHIVRGETQGKVVRVMTFEAFMELHAVDFDRKQSDSVELTLERLVHHLEGTHTLYLQTLTNPRRSPTRFLALPCCLLLLVTPVDSARCLQPADLSSFVS